MRRNPSGKNQPPEKEKNIYEDAEKRKEEEEATIHTVGSSRGGAGGGGGVAGTDGLRVRVFISRRP